METTYLLNVHQTRHLHIRRTINKLITYFKGKENEYRRVESPPFQWRARQGHSHVSHQDASTKIDLPSTVFEKSSDITRWRFGASTHCSPVTGDAVVLSHEQGEGPKNTSQIIELILLDHLLS